MYSIHIIPLVPFVGIQSNHGQESLDNGNTIDLVLSNPTASGAREWDYSFSSDLWSL